MTQQNRPPEPKDKDWQTWGRRMMSYLSQTRSALVQQTGSENAADDGTIMWDRQNLYPVASRSGAFKEVVLKNTAPTSSVGVTGDKAGLISWDASYIYVCTAAYDASSNIWKRATLTGGSW
jgi:hypothetical protein